MLTAAALPAARPDNLFGICHRVGRTFGFDPLWLRLAFLAGMLADFQVTLAAYAILGLVLVASMAIAGELQLRRHPAGTSLT